MWEHSQRGASQRSEWRSGPPRDDSVCARHGREANTSGDARPPPLCSGTHQ
ncbi:membrane-spanning 4-domains subfamily A member 3-like [Prionailurus iriomotensis]